MKLLVTGARGFLGARICEYYGERAQVVPLTRKEVDITDAAAVRDAVRRADAELCVHCAAISDTGYAQRHPEESLAINVGGSVHLARACGETGTKLVYMSSDQVYTGEQEDGLLTEETPLHPVNVYGRHKLLAEREIAAVLPEAVGLRLTWMFDLPGRGRRLNDNLLWNLQRAALAGERLTLRTGETRGFTYVWQVAEQLSRLARLPGGVYNCGCENRLSSWELGSRAAELMGAPDAARLITPAGDLRRNISISTARLQARGIEFGDSLRSVERCLREYGYIQ